jgi:DNA-binding CsgD family transcriptional regulator
MPLSTTPPPELIQELCSVAMAAQNLVGFRRAVLGVLQRELHFDAALFHELSPRVPLSHAAVVGIEVELLERSSSGWDELAVYLQPLMEVALEQAGAATDGEAFPSRSLSRREWQRRVAKPLGIRGILVGHLLSHGRAISAVVLMRRQRGFLRAERQWLGQLLECLTLGDGYWQSVGQRRFTGLLVQPVCRDQRLTPRQREVVEAVALGRTNRQIAEMLHISANTVRNTLAEVCERLGAGNRADVVRLAVLSST